MLGCMSWVKKIDEGTARNALTFIKNLSLISLPRFRIVGDYVRYDEPVRNQLKDLKQKITHIIQTYNDTQENFLIWGPQGSGKSEFARQLAKSFGSVVHYEELNLADLKEEDFREALGKLKDANKPVLCLVDEIDSKLAEQWSCEIMLPHLESKTPRRFSRCFILTGSGGSDIEEMKSMIGSRPKGRDLLSRIPYGNEFTVPPIGMEDRLVVALSNLFAVAKKSRFKVQEVDKLALLYVALNPNLSQARKIGHLMTDASNRIPRGEDRLTYDRLFETSSNEKMEFWQRWQNENLFNSFVTVEDSPDGPLGSGNYGRARKWEKSLLQLPRLSDPNSLQQNQLLRVEPNMTIIYAIGCDPPSKRKECTRPLGSNAQGSWFINCTCFCDTRRCTFRRLYLHCFDKRRKGIGYLAKWRKLSGQGRYRENIHTPCIAWVIC